VSNRFSRAMATRDAIRRAESRTFVIDTADERGIPAAAHCGTCGGAWQRPDDDPHADTLPAWARAHRCCHVL
jgi:hypothetical protein